MADEEHVTSYCSSPRMASATAPEVLDMLCGWGWLRFGMLVAWWARGLLLVVWCMVGAPSLRSGGIVRAGTPIPRYPPALSSISRGNVVTCICPLRHYATKDTTSYTYHYY